LYQINEYRINCNIVRIFQNQKVKAKVSCPTIKYDHEDKTYHLFFRA
jgi:hypothetical protein